MRCVESVSAKFDGTSLYPSGSIQGAAEKTCQAGARYSRRELPLGLRCGSMQPNSLAQNRTTVSSRPNATSPGVSLFVCCSIAPDSMLPDASSTWSRAASTEDDSNTSIASNSLVDNGLPGQQVGVVVRELVSFQLDALR